MAAPAGVRLDVAQRVPERGDGLSALAIAADLGRPVNDVVRTLNALCQLGLVRRRVPGDGDRETPVARWVRIVAIERPDVGVPVAADARPSDPQPASHAPLGARAGGGDADTSLGGTP